MFKYFHIVTLFFLVLGCAHSADGKPGKAPAKTASEVLQAGESATEVTTKSSAKSRKEAQKSEAKTPTSEVEALIWRYKLEAPVKVKIRKRIQSPYLTKEKVSSGELKLGKNIFRLDLEKPDNSTMVLDGKNIWVEQRLDADMGGEIQVSKFSMNETRRANAIFAVLFDNSQLEEGFKLVSVNSDDKKGKTFVYEPKKQAVDYKQLSISISPEKKQLVSFSYEDELENKVIYDFGKTTFKAKLKKWQLEYTPPRGVKPSEF